MTRSEGEGRDKRSLVALFAAWLLLIGWLAWNHVFWRDEVRAFSFALSGSTVTEMLHNVHGEGHPALWYLILRGLHAVFPYREVLPIIAALIGIAAMSVLTFASPFRTWTVALILFSAFGAFEYVVVARNYGISMLVMFGLAALYSKIRNSVWLGLFIALLCNTNVPSCFLGAAFLLFRFVEMVAERSQLTRRDWGIFLGNAVIAAGGALLCFRTVYPTFNDDAVSTNFRDITAGQIIFALIDDSKAFHELGPPAWGAMPTIILGLSCLAFIRKPAALCASVAALITLKLFFYFVYLSYYRHEALFVVFLLCLHWMTADHRQEAPDRAPVLETLRFVGICAFLELLVIQTVLLGGPIYAQFAGIPYSRSADVAGLLQRPQLHGAIVMADPDTMLEPLAYYVDNPLWLLREQRFGKVVRLTRKARQHLSIDDVLADGQRLGKQSGRPVIFLAHTPLKRADQIRTVLFDDTTAITPESYDRFMKSTRLVSHLPRATTGEFYDVYLFRR